MTYQTEDEDPDPYGMKRCRAAEEQGETAFKAFRKTGVLPNNPFSGDDERFDHWVDGFMAKRWEADGKPRLSMEEEEAIYAEGKAARRNEQKTGVEANSPYDRHSLVDVFASNRHEMWLTGYIDGGPSSFEVLGTPTAVTVEREHADGSVTYSMPASGQKR